MLLSNIGDNIMKAPMAATGHMAAHEQARVEAAARQAERLDQSRQAEEVVAHLRESEQEGVRTDREPGESVDPDRRRRRRAARGGAGAQAEEEPPPSPPPARPSDGHRIDITI